MKKALLRIALVAGGIASAAIIISCVCQSPNPGGGDKLVLCESFIFIPGTAITEDDQKAMNDILAQYRTSLYLVDTYKKGTPKTQGTLPVALIGEAVLSQVRANAQLKHLDGSAIQVGFAIGTRHHQGAPIGTRHVSPTPGTTVGTRHVPPPPGGPIGTKHHTTPPPGEISPPSDEDYEEAAALVKRLKPILKKYRH